jgi:hypothetical protein
VSARIYAPTSEHERDGNDKQDADGNRQNLDGVPIGLAIGISIHVYSLTGSVGGDILPF